MINSDNMYRLPRLFLEDSSSDENSCLIRLYDNRERVENAKTVMESNVLSFLLKGEKRIFLPDHEVSFDNSSFILLKKGHYLISEKKDTSGEFKSILFFFDIDFLLSFFKKYNLPLSKSKSGDMSFGLFKKDELMNSIVASVIPYLRSGTGLSEDICCLKVEEILLQITRVYGSDSLLFLLTGTTSKQDLEFLKIVEQNLFKNFTIDELAFLCHMSPSTFRRHFLRLFKISPARWITQKRLEKAKDLLEFQRISVSEVYLKVGFDSLSGFIQAFKKQYGITPKQYQMTV